MALPDQPVSPVLPILFSSLSKATLGSRFRTGVSSGSARGPAAFTNLVHPRAAICALPRAHFRRCFEAGEWGAVWEGRDRVPPFSIAFQRIPFQSVPLHSIPLHFIAPLSFLFHPIPLHCIPNNPVAFYSIRQVLRTYIRASPAGDPICTLQILPPSK